MMHALIAYKLNMYTRNSRNTYLVHLSKHTGNLYSCFVLQALHQRAVIWLSYNLIVNFIVNLNSCFVLQALHQRAVIWLSYNLIVNFIVNLK